MTLSESITSAPLHTYCHPPCAHQVDQVADTMQVNLRGIPTTLSTTWGTVLAHAHLVILDGACDSRLTVAAAAKVLNAGLGLVDPSKITVAVLARSRPGRWPMPLPLPLPLPKIEGDGSGSVDAPRLANRVWNAVRSSALQEWAIAAHDPTGLCCQLLLNHVPLADLTAVMEHPSEPLRCCLKGKVSAESHQLGVYCRWMALSASDIAGLCRPTAPHPESRASGAMSTLVEYLHSVSASEPSQHAASFYVKYIGQGVCMARCWEQADRPDGGGRALPRPFQDLTSKSLASGRVVLKFEGPVWLRLASSAIKGYLLTLQQSFMYPCAGPPGRSVLQPVLPHAQTSTVMIDEQGIRQVAMTLTWPIPTVLNVAEALLSVVTRSNFSSGGLNVAP